MLNELVGNHHLVEALWSAVNAGSGSLANVAPLVKRVLETEAWRRREIPQLGRVVEFDQFLDFVKTAPLEGCGWPPEKVEVLIKDDPAVLTMWRRATTAPAHAHHDNNNMIIRPVQGTSLAYTLDRLSREKPDLYAEVVAGNMSANAAATKAGWRKKLTPFEQILKLLPKLTTEEREELRKKL